MLKITTASANLFKIHLSRAGYTVFEASNGIDALDALNDTVIHLILADIMMPKMDGYELTGQLRSAKISIPILIITAKEALEDKRIGFKKGADDYMVKPINMEELLLRVEALLRRSNIAGRHILNVGDMVLNQESLTVLRGEQVQVLPQKEFYLLQMLLAYPGKIFTRQALMDEIWGYGSETDPRTIDVHIKRLRERFFDYDNFAIETVRGLGYRGVIKS